MFRADYLVRTVGFGLRAREQSLAWRVAVAKHPDTSPADSVKDGEAPGRALFHCRRGEHR